MSRALIASVLAAVLVAVSVTSPRAMAAPPPAPRATDTADGWPGTRAGALGRGWVRAFDEGEAAMRAFLARELAPRSLESKGVPQRIARYRELREKYGSLELVSVVQSRPEKLTVRLRDADGASHEFVFNVQVEAPFKLESVGIKQPGHLGFGGHGGFGH